MGAGGRGILAMAGAAGIWGLAPIFFKALAVVPPLEIVAHRTFWALVFLLCWLALQGRLREVASLLGSGRLLARVMAAALLIGTNWLLFIWAVLDGRTLQASLGYYIYPLIAVLTGRLVLGEQLSLTRWCAVALAGAAVAVLTAGLGVPPWVALALAISFAAYGLVKRGLPAGPVVSVTGEAVLLVPLALAWLVGVHFGGWVDPGGRPGAVFGTGWRDSLMLVAAGPVTALPLILFSYAARRLTYATLGLVQYLSPTLQAFVAALIFLEPVTRWHLIALPLIWLALALYSTDLWRQERSARKRSASSPVLPTTPT
ncbi:MAG: EamA family transporter RarD [Alphaproteobacteria bacterium HGW-Alphaproteobacteria-2]|nr:MAG: EamA family transporter RarD [Alphaproteobacteria bacterium HGW-Alphaproteobacteria-2]